jgi:molybdopterin/thiamine biosynthesis adenylyltransferase
MAQDLQALGRMARELASTEGERMVIGVGAVSSLASERGVSRREVEVAALQAGVAPRRYLRNLGTIGLEGQARLLGAAVAIVGLGGLGGYVLEGLARMGVGRLVLIDGDVFEETNLNRQLLSQPDRLGRSKVKAALERVQAVNGAVDAVGCELALSAENLPDLLAGTDVAVDCLDSLPSRLMMQEGAQALGIPMVHGSIAGFLGQVMTILPGDPGLRTLYASQADLPERGLEAEVGTPAGTPMAVAAWQVQEVVKIILDRGGLLQNRLLVMDMEAGTVQVLRLN